MTAILRCSSAFTLATALSSLFWGGLGGCRDRPAEPELAARTSQAAVAPLVWKAPPSWNRTETSETSARRASYTVPRAAGDPEDAELLVLFYGTGSGGDRDKSWDEWFGQFDGDAKWAAKREAFEVGGMKVETFELLGTYKLNMGPRRPGQKTSPVQSVKKNFRMIGVIVRTADRGNWFLRLVGPDATVLTAREAFLGMLKELE